MFRIGSARIEKVHDMDLNSLTLTQLLPTLDPNIAKTHPERLPEGTFDAEGHAFLSLHSWLVRHDDQTILIDTGAGNDKSRPQQKVLDGLSNPFLERLKDAGVEPEQVDYVLHTHIHSDHVGWNTRWDGERWVPTFPNATVICSDLECRYGAALADSDEASVAATRTEAGLGEPIRIPVLGTFDDSMRPIEQAGRLRRVKVDGEEVLPGIRFLSTPGHSIDHASIELVSGDDRAVFGGDVLHHPVEVYDPALLSCFCEFPDAARRSRHEVLAGCADRKTIFFSSHFPLSSAGVIERREDGYTWRFLDPDA